MDQSDPEAWLGLNFTLASVQIGRLVCVFRKDCSSLIDVKSIVTYSRKSQVFFSEKSKDVP